MHPMRCCTGEDCWRLTLTRDEQPLLSLRKIFAGYGDRMILKNINLVAREESVTVIIGHNGVGKSTLLKVIFGLLQPESGHISINGEDIESPSPRQMLNWGVSFCPQGGRVFGEMSVRENLEISSFVLRDAQARIEVIRRVTEDFPFHKYRMSQRADTLSGGERQMLALACALVQNPRILLLDEPSLGLSPDKVREGLERIKRVSREYNVACIVVEQKVCEALEVADRVYALRDKTVRFEGPPGEFMTEDRLREIFL